MPADIAPSPQAAGPVPSAAKPPTKPVPAKPQAPAPVPAAPVAPARVKPIRGVLQAPPRVIVYGPSGVGKSSLIADAEGVTVIDAEDGTPHLDVERYRWRATTDGHVPRSYAEIISAIDDIADSDDFKSTKTLAIIGLGAVERLIFAHILERDSTRDTRTNEGKKKLRTIEDYGYSKGFTIAVDVWVELLSKLDRCRAKRNCAIVMEGHSAVQNFKNPAGDDFGRITLSINQKAAGLLIQSFDVVGYLAFEEWGVKDEEGGKLARVKGVGSGRRVLKTERTATHDAKARWPIPDDLEIPAEHPWAAIAAAIREGQCATTANLRAQIDAELARIGDDVLIGKVHAAASKAGDDTTTLGRYLNDLRKRAALQTAETEPAEETTTPDTLPPSGT